MSNRFEQVDLITAWAEWQVCVIVLIAAEHSGVERGGCQSL